MFFFLEILSRNQEFIWCNKNHFRFFFFSENFYFLKRSQKKYERAIKIEGWWIPNNNSTKPKKTMRKGGPDKDEDAIKIQIKIKNNNKNWQKKRWNETPENWWML